MQGGTVLSNRYRIEEFVGQGGIASIYRATDNVLKQEVAMKVIHPHLRQQKIVLERFKREVSITRKIKHPAVIKIFEFIDHAESEQAFLVMEYLSGGDLKGRIIDEGPLPCDEVISMGKHLLEALGEAHHLGIIHRDIKPHNILFDSHGNVRISDFGLARSGELLGITTFTTVAGTPEYIAPEMAETVHVDARADLYSMGITLYEMATGRLPFLSNSPYQTIKMHAEAVPEPPRKLNELIPEGLERVILKALEKDPGDRFQSAEEFAGALETLSVASTKSAIAKHNCPDCGSEVVDVFPYCFSCGREPLLLERSRETAETCNVYIVGPGKAADRISHEARFKLMGLLSDANVLGDRLEKRLPRLPFLLMNDLDRGSAEELVMRLGEIGLEALSVDKHARQEKRAVWSMMLKKVKNMSLRYYLIMVCFSGGMTSSFKNMPALVAFLFIIMILLSVPTACLLRYMLPEMQWSPLKKIRPRKILLSLARKLTNSSLQSIAQRLAGKGEVIRLSIQKSVDLPEELSREILEALDGIVQQGYEWILQAQKLDDFLKEADENNTYVHLAEIEQEIAEADTIERTEQLMRNREDLTKKTDFIRKMEQGRELLFDRLLKISSRLDALAVKLAQISTKKVGNLLNEVTTISQDLKIEIEGYDDVERYLKGIDT